MFSGKTTELYRRYRRYIIGGKKVILVKDKNLFSLIKNLDHTLLHARTLKFVHPFSKQPMTFTAPIPESFRSIAQVAFGKIYDS